MKKRKSQFILIDFAIYPYNLLVCLEATEEETIKFLKRKFKYILSDEEKEVIKMAKNGNGRFCRLKNGAYVMRINNDIKTARGLATLAHETFHAVHFLMNDVGITLSDESDEAYAYLTGYIIREVTERMK